MNGHELVKLKKSISFSDQYCDGFGSPGASGNGYILGVMLGVGKGNMDFNHKGSVVLDGINAFDKSEVEDVFLGQINMTIVSSFCGLSGLVWGYDIVRHPDLCKETLFTVQNRFIKENSNKEIPVYSATPLLEATRMLLGTLNGKRFPLMPGSHVPCAGKNIKFEGPKIIYSALGMGIPSDRNKNAILLMEDMGWLRSSREQEKEMVLKNLSNSVVQIGYNQKVEYKEILVIIKSIYINKGEIGCALVAAPYLTLAKKVIPNNNHSLLIKKNIFEWEKLVSKDFLCNNK